MKAGAVRGNRRGSLEAIPEERMPDRLAEQKLSGELRVADCARNRCACVGRWCVLHGVV